MIHIDTIKLPTKEEEENFINYEKLIHERVEAVRNLRAEFEMLPVKISFIPSSSLAQP